MKKLKNYKYLPFIILFVVMLICHMIFKLNFADDLFFQHAADNGFVDYLLSRYNIWTSRIFIEAILIIMLKLPSIFWYISDSLIITLSAYSITKLFSIKNTWWILLLVLIYPLYEASGAGWYATTINYIWPLALGLFSLIPIKNAIDNKQEKNYMYPLYVLSLLFACNQEQMCAILFAFYLIFTIFLFKKKDKKILKFILVQLLLTFVSLIFILTCPGNDVRIIEETATWYPSYANFGLIDKLFLGLVSTFYYCVYEVNILILIFSILLSIFIFKKGKNEIIRFISLIPILVYCSFTFFPSIIKSIFPHVYELINGAKIYGLSPESLSLSLQSLFIFAVSVIFFVSLLFSIYKLFGKKNNYLMSLVFLAGLFSRIILGFSPTVFASGMRTFIFFDFSIIIVLSVLFDKNKKLINQNYCYICLSITAIVQIMHTLIVSI